MKNPEYGSIQFLMNEKYHMDFYKETIDILEPYNKLIKYFNSTYFADSRNYIIKPPRYIERDITKITNRTSTILFCDRNDAKIIIDTFKDQCLDCDAAYKFLEEYYEKCR